MKAIYIFLILSVFCALTAQAHDSVTKNESPDKCIANNDGVFWRGINKARKEIYKIGHFKFSSVVFVKGTNRINSCKFVFDLFVKGEYFAHAEIVLMKSGWKSKSRKMIKGNDEVIW